MVALKQRIPVRTPDHLDDIPSRSTEHALQLVDNPLIPAHWAVKSLKIAIDNKDQVVQLLPRTQRDRSQRIHLVCLAISNERPHLALGHRNQSAMLQIPHE